MHNRRKMEKPARKILWRKADWSNLPEELIGIIAGNLKLHGGDHQRFRSICRKWRNSTSPSAQFFSSDFPYEIPSNSGQPNFLIPNVVYILYPLSQNHDLQKTKPWIVAIEEFRKLKICCPLTRNPIGVTNLHKSLNLLDFGSRIVDFGVNLRLARPVEDVFASNNARMNDWKNYTAKMKCILLNGVVVVLLLYLRGALGTVRVNEEWKFSEFCPDCLFDDIVEYKGHVCIINPAGSTWLINDIEGEGCPYGFSQKLSKFPYHNDFRPSARQFCERRKRLAVHDGVLYLIIKGSDKLQVFKLNEEVHEWDRVYSLGDKILFVTFDKCIFIDACYLGRSRGDYIVFPKNCFPYLCGDCSNDVELFQGAQKHLEFAVYNLDSNSLGLISSYPELCELFSPPPSWFWSGSCSQKRFSEEEEKVDCCGHIGSESISVEQSVAAFSPGKNGNGSEDPHPSSSQDTALKEIPCEKNDKSDPTITAPHQISKSGAAEKSSKRIDVSLDLVKRIPSLKRVDVGSSPHVTSPIKKALTKFQGADISSNLIPVLKTIWNKYGNIIEGHVVHSNVLLAWALESLANMIIILQRNTGDSLNDSQAEYLKSTLADLQMMHFRLDWLSPFIERALAVRKIKNQRAIVMDLEIRKSKLLDELSVLEEQLVQQEKLVDKSFINSAPSILKKSLAEGL